MEDVEEHQSTEPVEDVEELEAAEPVEELAPAEEIPEAENLEELQPEPEQEKSESGEDFRKNFVIYKPFDFTKEKTENSDLESSVFANPEENFAPQKEEAYLEELSFGKDGFMFTTFAENDNNVTELPLDSIVLGEDGVFHISADVSKIEMPIDEDFKKLVDSVIH